MGTDSETKEKLLRSAKREFLEKGFLKASLRKICADAGVTTGAMYFFFKDKEALFGAIVEEPLQALMKLLLSHFSEESEFGHAADYVHEDGDHDALAAALVHHLYSHYDSFIMLLTKAQGTCYEDCLDRIVDITEQNYLKLAEKMAETQQGMIVNLYMTHWLTHIHIDAFVHLLTHESDEESAQRQMKRMMEFFVTGFMKMALIPENEI